MKVKDKLIRAFPVDLFFFLTAGFFSCMEVYMGNYNEFTFPFSQVWWILLGAALAAAAGFSALKALLPEKVSGFLTIAEFAAGLCFYLQCMFLNGKMQSFTGEDIVFDRSVTVPNLILWAVLLTAVLIPCSVLIFRSYAKNRSDNSSKSSTAISETYSNNSFPENAAPIKNSAPDRTLSALWKTVTFVSLALLFMQTAGFVTNALNLPKSDVLKQGYFSSDGEYELGSENNVVWFIIDACDGEIVEKALDNHPDLFDGFDGFTYYPDCVPTYSRTYPSIIYLLTHEPCYLDQPYEQYVSEAWEHTGFIPGIKQTGADIRLYTEPRYLGLSALNYVDNYRTYSGKALEILNPSKLINQMLHVSLYRGLPYALKPRFSYNVTIMNSLVMKLPSDTAIQFDDYTFYNNLAANGVTVSDSYRDALRFYHLWGTHSGSHLAADCSYKDGASNEEALLASLKIIRTYLEDMKELGLYDNATILVTADHGFLHVSNTLELGGPATCILLVKPSGADKNQPMQTSGISVSHENLYSTVLDGFGISSNPANYEPAIPAMSAEYNEASVRHHYLTVTRGDLDSEIALREYEITGDARNYDNWKLTGRYWDALYSERGVGKERLFAPSAES